MADRALELARAVSKRTQGVLGKELAAPKSRYDKSWWRNFFEALASDENLNPGLTTFRGLHDQDGKVIAEGLAKSATAGLKGNVAKDASAAVVKIAGKAKDKLAPAFAKLADETGAIGDVAASKVGTATKLIEDSGGGQIKVNGNKISWVGKDGVKRSADLTQRFGSRSLGLNPRATQSSPRDYSLNPRTTEATEGFLRGKDAKHTPSLKTVANIARGQTHPALRSADAAGMSTEEIARQGTFYRLGKNGEPTYLGKKVDPGGAGGTVIQVSKDGKASIYQGSGQPADLARFQRTATFKDIVQKSRKGEEGAVTIGGGGKRKPFLKPNTVIRSQQVPKVTLPASAKLVDKHNGRKIVFASDFDKGAYNLTLKKNPVLLKRLMRGGLDANTVAQHGAKVKAAIEKAAASGKRGAIKLHPRSITVIGNAPTENAFKSILGLPSEFKFSIDLPAMRQGFRAGVMHPVKSGLPALKKSLGSITEKGYLNNLEKIKDEIPLYDILDTVAAVGDTKGRKLFPQIDTLRKLPMADATEYFTGATLGKRLPIIGELPKASERMYDMFMKSMRGTEMERMAEASGSSIWKMAKDPDATDDLLDMITSVRDRTGHGGLGPLEGKAAEALTYGFTAPRNTAAKMHLYNPLNLLSRETVEKVPVAGPWLSKHKAAGRYGSGQALKEHRIDTVKLAALYGAGVTAADHFGAETTFDPLSNKPPVKFGNYAPDMYGGERAVPRLGYRTIADNLFSTHDRTSAKGTEYESNLADDARRFVRGRIRPGIASMANDFGAPPFFGMMGGGYDSNVASWDNEAKDWTIGEGARTNFLGEDISKPYEAAEGTPADIPYSRWITEQFVPSYPEDIHSAFQYGGTGAGLASIPLGFLGMGSTSFDPYEDNPYRPPKRKVLIDKTKKAGPSADSDSGYGTVLR